MALAYTPGLKRKSFSVITKTRRLPIFGKVLVKEGDKVSYDTIVATTMVPGPLKTVDVSYFLEVEADVDEFKETYKCDIRKYMLKKEGDQVKKDEVIAMRKLFFGTYKKVAYSPVDGTVDTISDTSGQVMIATTPHPLDVNAYIPGIIVSLIPNEGVEIETRGALIQGIFGVGGEVHGNICMLSESPDDFLTTDKIDEQCKEKILVGGAGADIAAIKKAIAVKASCLIIGGIRAQDIKNILGREIGVAITGHEDLGLTLILTEGFGRMRMAEKTFDLLKNHEGKLACVNGTTQIRAGVMRPEVFIPLLDQKMISSNEKDEIPMEGLRPGLPVRVVQTPYFGALGKVKELPIEPQELETESRARVLVVELEDGRNVVVPRANVELIEE